MTRNDIIHEFEFISKCYNPDIIKKDFIIQLKIIYKNPELDELLFFLKTENNKCKLFIGVSKNFDLSIAIPIDLWNKIRSRKIGKIAILYEVLKKEKIKISGNTSIFFKLTKIFGGSLNNQYFSPTGINEHKSNDEDNWEVPKKIVILSGSGRNKKKSVSYHLADKFALGLSMAQPKPDIELFHLRDYKVTSCAGCYKCWEGSGNCILNDDFKKNIGAKLLEADLVVISYPVFLYNFPPEIIGVLSRLYGYDYPHLYWNKNKKQLKNFEKQNFRFSVFLIGTGDSFDESHFKTQELQMKILSKMHNVKYKGIIKRLSSGSFLLHAGRSLIHEDVEQAFVDAGHELALYGKINKKTRRRAELPVSNPALLRSSIAGYFDMAKGDFDFPIIDYVNEISKFDMVK